MFVIGVLATPFIILMNWIARGFLFLSNGCYAVYQAILGASMWLNDITEADVWPKE